MADCGATGSALDQTARALLGSSGVDTSKVASSILGHASLLPNQAAMAVAAPTQIVMPGAQSTTATSHPAVTAVAAAPTMMRQQHAMPPEATMMTRHPSLQHQQHPMMMQPPMMQQQQHSMAMAAAQQQQMAMAAQQQQQFMMMQQQQQQFLMMQQQQQAALQKKAAKVEEPAIQGHEGIVHGATIDELAAAWKEASVDTLDDDVATTVGHEGMAHGAKIEELAAAWAQAEAEYEELEAAVNMGSTAQGNEAEALLQPPAMEYQFVNRVSDPQQMPQQDWMEEGMREFNRGNLSKAIRAFEMELQCGDADNAMAWKWLGQCHAENDQDALAISCLEQAVDRDPYEPSARLALGVSQVNELQHAQALASLKAWITHNPQFSSLASTVDAAKEADEDVYGAGEDDAATGDVSAFDEVQRLLLGALQIEPNSPDVLEALGVVYNVSRDYEAAMDAFERAIALQPENYQLYNRLGATRANCNQSQDALPAYTKALSIKPKYARAWLNMAISHSNLGDYEQASRCYLQTLALNPAAQHCWSYLRIALSCNEQWDLIPFTTSMDLQAFAEHFDFVMHDENGNALAPPAPAAATPSAPLNAGAAVS